MNHILYTTQWCERFADAPFCFGRDKIINNPVHSASKFFKHFQKVADRWRYLLLCPEQLGNFAEKNKAANKLLTKRLPTSRTKPVITFPDVRNAPKLPLKFYKTVCELLLNKVLTGAVLFAAGNSQHVWLLRDLFAPGCEHSNTAGSESKRVKGILSATVIWGCCLFFSFFVFRSCVYSV